MARPTRSRTRNLSLGPLVQHKPPSPRPGRNHTATSRKQTHNNTKESGLNKPTQNPGLDTASTRLDGAVSTNQRTCTHRFRQSADPFSQNGAFLAVFIQWVCSLATAPPHVGASPPPIGGICIIRGVTRRRHAEAEFLMLQNPTAGAASAGGARGCVL